MVIQDKAHLRMIERQHAKRLKKRFEEAPIIKDEGKNTSLLEFRYIKRR